MEGSPKAFPRFTNMMWKLALFMYVHTTYENITIHLRLTSGQPKQIVDFKNYKQLTSIWLTSTFEAFLNPHHWLHKLSPCIVQVHLGVNPSNKLCVERKKKWDDFKVTTSLNYGVGHLQVGLILYVDPKRTSVMGPQIVQPYFKAFGHLEYGWTTWKSKSAPYSRKNILTWCLH